MFRATSATARALATNSKKAAFTTSAIRNAPLRVGINGFGRIGRLVLRAAQNHPEIEVVAVNDPFIDTNYIEYMFKYDTVHGRYKGAVSHDEHNLIIDGKKVRCFQDMKAGDIKWDSVGADYIVDATGVYARRDGGWEGGRKGGRNEGRGYRGWGKRALK
eukprot:evm.model.NODE_8653_length_7507_cov_21.255362.1